MGFVRKNNLSYENDSPSITVSLTNNMTIDNDDSDAHIEKKRRDNILAQKIKQILAQQIATDLASLIHDNKIAELDKLAKQSDKRRAKKNRKYQNRRVRREAEFQKIGIDFDCFVLIHGPYWV